MRLSEYASTRKTRGSYKMPRSVQQSIPIDRIYADGVWQSGNVFSRMWQISDINYAMQSDAAKQNILTQLGTLYAGIPADCWMQVCIVSQRMDEKAFAHDVLYHRENDGYDALRAERNRLIKASARENGNVVQHKYIIISTNKTGVKDARERFVQVQGHLLSAFSALECAVTPLDNRARLEVLHKFFRISEEGRYQFDFDNCAKLRQDFRDYVAPDCIKFCKKHIEIEDSYAKCMTISEYPQQLDDKFVAALLQQVPYIVLSIDIEPVETEDAFKEIDNAQMKTDAEKVRFNKKSVENLDFTSSVPQRTQEQDRIIASIRKEMTEHDQQMFLTLLTVTYFADTLEDLALETDALKATAANYNCRFTELYFQQERAFNTAMPYGLRRIESVRTMLTKSLTALVPFNTQEILTPGGICYGRNAVTGNLIIGLRTTLVNGNAMVVATSGGGKSMLVKLEILIYYVVLTYKTYDGKRKTKWQSTGLPTKGNKKRAEAMMRELQDDFEPPVDPNGPPSKAMLFADFLVQWLEIAKSTVKLTTYSSYKGLSESQIIPYFRSLGVTLGDLKAVHIQSFYQKQLERVKQNTVIHYHAIIHRALKYAVKTDLIDVNPADKVDRPKKNEFTGNFYSREEMNALFDAVRGNKIEIPVMLAAFYGLRRSEVVGLKWDAVDFEQNTLEIRHTVATVRLDGKKVIVESDTTKTKASKRTLPLVPVFRERLLALQEEQKENRKLCGRSYNKKYDGYICVDPMGNLLMPNALSDSFQLVLRDYNLRRIRFHDLRHSCASLLLANNVPMKQIQEWLGHSDFSTTANIYSHLDYSSKVSSAEAMLNGLGMGSNPQNGA